MCVTCWTQLRRGSPPWGFSSSNSLPTVGCQKPDQLSEVLNSWYVCSLSRATYSPSPECYHTVKGNTGILYLETSKNKAFVTLSQARVFTYMHQKRVSRNRAQQGSPVNPYICLGMAGRSHIWVQDKIHRWMRRDIGPASAFMKKP